VRLISRISKTFNRLARAPGSSFTEIRSTVDDLLKKGSDKAFLQILTTYIEQS
tara:strand:- start:213 stop:371 length:159 start_codon:yes stop_codon:yes gene_type:complete